MRREVLLAALALVALVSCGPPSPPLASASSSQTVAPVANDNFLLDVACSTATDCIAVGYAAHGHSVGPDNRTLIVENTGHGWSLVPSPNGPGSAGSTLSGIACVGPHNCIAVGSSDSTASESTTLVEQSKGNGWRILPSPNAPDFGGNGAFLGIGCASAARCVAVGTYESGNDFSQTLIAENTGAGWSVVASPDVSPRDDERLMSVTCPRVSFCVAVGSETPTGGNAVPLLEQNSGSGWVIIDAPLGVGGLSGVACPAPNLCVATGGELAYSGTEITVQPLIAEMVDRAWVTTHVSVADAKVLLGRVVCPAASYCMAAASLGYGNEVGAAFVAERSDGHWTISRANLPGSSPSFAAVACPEIERCVAVGNQLTATGYPQANATVIAERTANGWTLQPSPNV